MARSPRAQVRTPLLMCEAYDSILAKLERRGFRPAAQARAAQQICDDWSAAAPRCCLMRPADRSCRRRRAGRPRGCGEARGRGRVGRAARGRRPSRRTMPLLSRACARHGDRQRQSSGAVRQSGDDALSRHDRRQVGAERPRRSARFRSSIWRLASIGRCGRMRDAFPGGFSVQSGACRERGRSTICRLAALLTAKKGATIGEAMSCSGPLYERLWRPLLLAALNTDPADASAALAAAVVKETLALGGRACRPLVAVNGLSRAFVDPALKSLEAHGASIRFGRRLRRNTTMRRASSQGSISATRR